MPNEFDGISRETYMNSDPQTGRALTYDMLSEIRSIQLQIVDGCGSKRSECDIRIKKLEKKKIFDTSVSAITGIVGGMLAVILKPFFIK